MNFNINNFVIPIWVSYRSWLFNTPDSKTLISNEKSKEYIVLDSISSDLWYIISKYPNDLIDFIEKNSILIDDVLDFFNTLECTGCLINKLDTTENYITSDINTLQFSETKQSIIDQIAEWCFSKGFLFAIHWELTYQCNEKCIHCFNPGAAYSVEEIPQRNRNELTLQNCYEVIDQMVECGVFRLTISGGEATLRNDLTDIISYARKQGLCVVLFSNLLKIPKVFAERLHRLFLHKIEISMYSNKAHDHDQVTNVKGSFEKTLNNVKFLKKNDFNILIKGTFLKNTINSYIDLKQLAKNLDIPIAINVQISPSIGGKLEPLKHQINFEKIVELASIKGSPFFIGDKSNNFGEIKKDLAQRPCGAGIISLTINPEGDIFACIAMPIKLGNVLGEDNLLYVWNKSINKQEEDNFLSKWQKVTFSNLTDCGKHERCSWCESACPGDAYIQNNDLFSAAQNHCLQASARMTAAKLLKSKQTSFNN